MAQCDEIVTEGTEHGYTEEPVPFLAVTARSLQVGVAQAISSTPYHEELVVRRRPFADDLSWRKSKRHQVSLLRCGPAKWTSRDHAVSLLTHPRPGRSVGPFAFAYAGSYRGPG